MIRYKIHGVSGHVISVHDHCFRGLSVHTPMYYLHDWYVDGKDDLDEDAEEIFDNVRNNVDFVEYTLDKSNNLSKDILEIVENVSWIKEITTVVENRNKYHFLVSGDAPGDQMFHVLSSIRNIEHYYGESFLRHRNGLNPYQAFIMSMYVVSNIDFRGNPVYSGFNSGNDYMWANFDTTTKKSVRSVIENGPRWYLPRRSVDYCHQKLDFTPEVRGVSREDPDSIEWTSSLNKQLFRSFEIPATEGEEPEVFESPKELADYILRLIV